VVGVGAFSGSFLGLELVPSKRRCLVPPTSGYPLSPKGDPRENVRGRPPAVGRLLINHLSLSSAVEWVRETFNE
jgi:hypothetical protein